MLTAPSRPTTARPRQDELTVDDIDFFESTRRRAVVARWERTATPDHAKVNVNGGGIALGHPLGATAARLMTTLLDELERTGGRYGLQTMCEGGGQANVTIIEKTLDSANCASSELGAFGAPLRGSGPGTASRTRRNVASGADEGAGDRPLVLPLPASAARSSWGARGSAGVAEGAR